LSRILIIEDNADLAAGIEYNLMLEGYDVLVADTGTEGMARARDWSPDLVILDLLLPGAHGYQVLNDIRRQQHRIPVIVLSAMDEEHAKVRSFGLDADHYVTKPFGVLELLERVAALLRRTSRDRAKPRRHVFVFGDVEVDLNAQALTRAGHLMSLPPKAYDLLVALINRRGRAATRAELLREVWGYDPLITTRTVDSHIALLRRRLDDDSEMPRHIVTVWKVGYQLIP